MEAVATGYKNTKIGEIPEEWDDARLDDIIEVLTDYTANGSFASLKENVKVYNEPNYSLWIMARTLKSNDYQNEVRYTDERGYKFLKKTSLHGGELLMPKTGGLGKAYFFPHLKKNATLADNVFLIKPEESIKKLYLYHYLNSPVFKKVLNRNMYGTSQQTIVKKELRKLPIPLPALPEQKRIAEILSTVDEAIEQTQSIITETQKLKKGLMQHLFTKGIGHTKFKQTKIGEIPEEWEAVRLGDVSDVSSGGTPSRSNSDYFTGNIPWVTTTDLNYSFINETLEYITDEAIKKSSAKMLSKGTLLIAMYGLEAVGTRGKCGVMNIAGACNQACAAVNAIRGKTSNLFLFYYYQKLGEGIMKWVGGTKRQNLTLGLVNSLQIPLPDLNEQSNIVSILSEVDNKIEEENTNLNELQNLKKGLMQVLLTGKVRVKV